MFKKITQKIKNHIFKDTQNLEFLGFSFGFITEIRYMAKNDFSNDLILFRTQDTIHTMKLHKGNLINAYIPFWQLPFITEKLIINLAINLAYEKG